MEDYYQAIEDQRYYEENQREYQQYQYEKQERYYEESIYQEVLEEAAREDCYADYSGGKGPHTSCTYHTEPASSGASSSQGNLMAGICLLALLGLIVFIILKARKV